MIYIQTALYSFSNKYLKVNSLADFKVLQTVKLIPDTEVDLELKPLYNDNPSASEQGQSQVEDNTGIDLTPIGPALPSSEVATGTSTLGDGLPEDISFDASLPLIGDNYIEPGSDSMLNGSQFEQLSEASAP